MSVPRVRGEVGVTGGAGENGPCRGDWRAGHRAGYVAQLAKNPPAMREAWVPSLGGEDPLEKGMATDSSILAWRIPWTAWSEGSQIVGHD